LHVILNTLLKFLNLPSHFSNLSFID
jgi:hypothetical protein